MGTITSQSIVDKAEIILQDTTNTRWPSDELFDWLSDGQREIVLNKPDAYATNEAVVTVEGTKQTIPAAGITLIDVIRNMGVTDGTTPGNAIRIIEREILDAQRPDWHTETPVAVTLHYMFDKRDPKNFYVYPPQPGTDMGYLELIYSSAPPDPTDIAAVITLDDIYGNALLDYILYRAYSKDADYAANAMRAVGHLSAFQKSLGIKDITEDRDDPNMRATTVARSPADKG